jgi:hypothetical protein
MLLSLMLFLLIEYYYTIIGFSYWNYMYPNQRCMTLWECFLENFDLYAFNFLKINLGPSKRVVVPARC